MSGPETNGTATRGATSRRNRRTDASGPRSRHPRAGNPTPHVASARWRVALRLARRQAWRTKRSSLLVVILVALPIAAMAAFVIVAASMIGTPEEKARLELGEMLAWVQPAGVADAGFWQMPSEPTWTGYPVGPDGASESPEGAPPADPLAALPAGTVTVPITDGSASVRTADGRTSVPTYTGMSWDPRFAGRFDLVSGRAPANAGEALVTPAALDRLGVRVGGTLELLEPARTVTIVGTMRSAELANAKAAIFLAPEPGSPAPIASATRWYLPDMAPSWADVQKLNAAGIVAYSRPLVLDPPSWRPPVPENWASYQPATWWGQFTQIMLVMLIGAVFAGYVVVMLAGAAFAVAARRQQRALAIAASVGASRSDLSRTVLLQGTVLGIGGGILGVAAGIGLSFGVRAVIDNGSASQFWGVHIPWPVLAGILIFAIIVGTLSALVPSRTVARGDTIQALRGAGRPKGACAARPVIGSIMVVGGAALTIACGVWVAAVNANQTIPWDSPLRILPIWGIVLGPIVAQIGILISGHWLLWLTARALGGLSIAARIATRDAAANAARTVPAFAAVAATVFLGVFAVGMSTMQSAASARSWAYMAPVGSLAIGVDPGTTNDMHSYPSLTDADLNAGFAEAEVLARDAGAVTTARVTWANSGYLYGADGMSVTPGAVWTEVQTPAENLADPEQASYTSFRDPAIRVIAPGDLATVTGVELSASDLETYRAGGVLVNDPRFVDDGHVTLSTWRGEDYVAGRVPSQFVTADPGFATDAVAIRSVERPAVVIDAPAQPIVTAVAPATAAELDLPTDLASLYATFAEPPSAEVRDRLSEATARSSVSSYSLWAYFEDGPPSPLTWAVPILGGAAVLVLGASAVALGLARFERRPDDATLAAVGGTRALRRRVAFWQGLVIAGFGTIAGAVAGILPVVGLALQGNGLLRLEDVSWWLLAAFAIGLPLVIALANVLVPPRNPDLTRRTAIA